MRIGILADIHERVEHLRRALEEFQRRGVDTVVSLGDACDGLLGVNRTNETVAMLEQVHAQGVWGNHDFGLCYDVPNDIRQRYDGNALDFLATMKGRLAIGDCHFSHVEPWLDPHDIGQLWYYEGPPDTREKAHRSFESVPQRFLFIGHFHHWLVMTQVGRVEWNGEGPVVLADAPRYLVVIGAVLDGHCAVFDTDTCVLVPVCCGQNSQ